MFSRPSRLKLNWRDADALITSIHSQRPVRGLTHNFYKYPARFSPEFVATAIDVFTKPGDLVVDPFVGGGTTLVEARVAGRLSIGTDINSLASFVSRAKTQIFSATDFRYLNRWCNRLPDQINLRRNSTAGAWSDIGYTRNLECQLTWPIRKAIELALDEVSKIASKRRQSFARCVVLRAAQWALDGRKSPASVAEFREKLLFYAQSNLIGAHDFAAKARRADRLAPSKKRRRSVCLNIRAEGVAAYIRGNNRDLPKLIVTSPPYPGVHVLYHRWQIRGGKETPAPFWIADQVDGAGEAHYLMHARREGLNRYHAGIGTAFSALSNIARKDSVILQLVAFSHPADQLPQYLGVMEQSGFHELVLSEHVDSADGRIWRNVPGRKWHANTKGELNSGKEVVLIHKSR